MEGQLNIAPVKPDQLQKDMLLAPEDLVERGVSFYELQIEPPSKVKMRLYDESKSLFAVVELTEQIIPREFLYEIRLISGEEAWIHLKREEIDSSIVFSATSSSGGTLRVRLGIDQARNKPQAGLPINSVEINKGGVWKQVSINKFKATIPLRSQESIDSNPISKAEERKIFTGASLKLLRSVLHNFDAMLEFAIPNRVGKKKAGNVHRPAAFTRRLVVPYSCTVTCGRVLELIPLYVCDGGVASNCSCNAGKGFFLIGCGIYSLCRLDCSEFSDGAVT